MRYISTRGQAPALTFDQALLTGLAPDGGLYVPEILPQFSPQEISAMQRLSYPELAVRILAPFTEDVFDETALKSMVTATYAAFTHQAVAPLVQLDHQHFVLELFHGPTLAFKDFALQLLGHLMDAALTNTGEKALVLGATSGDTGSAAIAGLRGKQNLDIVILYPHGRPSEVQRRQMTTIADGNVHALAVNGTFDDCQHLVKTLFSDAAFRSQKQLLAVNSINIARVLAQIVYYFYAALSLGAPAKTVRFSVPTGNFGDIYAGYLAKQMGLPIETLTIATNANDILCRVLKTGAYTTKTVSETLSPSMDIQIASNFERLLFDLYGRNGAAITHAMQQLKKTGSLMLDPAILRDFARDFSAHKVDDATTMQVMKDIYTNTGYLLDPHTAVGVKAAQLQQQGHIAASPMITLATAHAAKFPDAVKQATGVNPALPANMADLHSRKERMIPMQADVATLKSYLEAL